MERHPERESVIALYLKEHLGGAEVKILMDPLSREIEGSRRLFRVRHVQPDAASSPTARRLSQQCASEPVARRCGVPQEGLLCRPLVIDRSEGGCVWRVTT